MKPVKRFTDWFQGYDLSFNEGDGYGDGSGGSIPYAWNMRRATLEREATGADTLNAISPMHMSSDDGPRTQRIFLCAGCVGEFECPIHGRRL